MKTFCLISVFFAFLLIVPAGGDDIYDYGDALVDMWHPYPVLMPGAGRHTIVPGVQLGWKIDPEPDGQPSIDADDDDLADLSDEDGIHFPTKWVKFTGGTGDIIAVTSSNGFLDGWIDFDEDGVWSMNPSEHVIIHAPISPPYTGFIGIQIPANSQVMRGVYARFRFSTDGSSPAPDSTANDGEVEDYIIWIHDGAGGCGDLGDAPDSTNNCFGSPMMDAYPPHNVPAFFPTACRPGDPIVGPFHDAPYNRVYLGDRATIEENADTGYDQDTSGGWLINNIRPGLGEPAGFDTDKADDGLLTWPMILPQCGYATFDIKVTTALNKPSTYYVNVWLDFNRDGDWDDVVGGCAGMSADEWAVQDWELPGTASFQQDVYRTPPFYCIHPDGCPDEIWMRITVSQWPWMGGPAPGSHGNGGGWAAALGYGETEDYYFIPDTNCPHCGDFDCLGTVDMPDFARFAQLWLNHTDYSINGPNGDFNCDGFVDDGDLDIMLEKWLQACD